jgi:dolichol-phosphate mannosyltransferase
VPELAVVLPTYNERDNIGPVLSALEQALEGLDYEVVIVDDDSDDGTAAVARHLAQSDSRIRVIERINRRGLASACVEGMMASNATYLAVMDADLQHDERILPAMLSKLKDENLDVVIGSRNAGGGSMGALEGQRVALSQIGRKVGKLVTHTDVSDPMSGFFVVDRRFLEEVVRSLSLTGFKILLDMLATSRRPVKLGEVGYTFRARQRGESKLDFLAGLEYLELILDKTAGNWIPASYLVFGLIGAGGVLVHLLMLRFLLVVAGIPFLQGQAIASVIAMTVNFVLNNRLTFRSFRLRGPGMWIGLALFYLACSVGLLINLEMAEFLRAQQISWYVAGGIGILLGSVWNYWVSSILVWRVTRRRLAARGRRTPHEVQ